MENPLLPGAAVAAGAGGGGDRRPPNPNQLELKLFGMTISVCIDILLDYYRGRYLPDGENGIVYLVGIPSFEWFVLFFGVFISVSYTRFRIFRLDWILLRGLLRDASRRMAARNFF